MESPSLQVVWNVAIQNNDPRRPILKEDARSPATAGGNHFLHHEHIFDPHEYVWPRTLHRSSTVDIIKKTTASRIQQKRVLTRLIDLSPHTSCINTARPCIRQMRGSKCNGHSLCSDPCLLFPFQQRLPACSGLNSRTPKGIARSLNVTASAYRQAHQCRHYKNQIRNSLHGFSACISHVASTQ